MISRHEKSHVLRDIYIQLLYRYFHVRLSRVEL
jgi:hypothetical protein